MLLCYAICDLKKHVFLVIKKYAFVLRIRALYER